jgi:MFS family permease
MAESQTFTHSSLMRWWVVILLSFAGILNTEDRTVIFSLLPLVRRDLLLSDLQMAFLMSVFLWVYAAFSPVAGYLGDRWDRRKVLSRCVFLWSILTAGSALVTSGRQLLGVRVLLGIVMAFFIPVQLALLADYHPRKTRGRALGLIYAVGGLGPIVGSGVAGWMGAHYGWRVPLVVLGAIGVGLAALMEFTVAPPSEPVEAAAPASRLWETVGTVMRTPTFLCLASVSGATSIAVYLLVTWLPLFLFDHYAIPLASSALLAGAAIYGPMIPAALLGGYLSDRFGTKTPKKRLAQMIIFLSLALPWPLLFWWASGWQVVLIATSLLLVFRTVAETNWFPVMYEVVTPEMRATATGVSNCSNCIFGGLGALLGGLLQQHLGLQACVGMVSLLLALGLLPLALCYFRLFDRDASRSASRPLVFQP